MFHNRSKVNTEDYQASIKAVRSGTAKQQGSEPGHDQQSICRNRVDAAENSAHRSRNIKDVKKEHIYICSQLNPHTEP
jgi:hypothetical protein